MAFKKKKSIWSYVGNVKRLQSFCSRLHNVEMLHIKLHQLEIFTLNEKYNISYATRFFTLLILIWSPLICLYLLQLPKQNPPPPGNRSLWLSGIKHCPLCDLLSSLHFQPISVAFFPFLSLTFFCLIFSVTFLGVIFLVFFLCFFLAAFSLRHGLKPEGEFRFP